MWHLLSERLAQGGCRWWSEELKARKVNSAQGEWRRLGWSQVGSLEPSRSTLPELELPLTLLVMNVLISCPAVSWLFSLNGFNEYTFKHEQIHLTLELFKLFFFLCHCCVSYLCLDLVALYYIVSFTKIKVKDNVPFHDEIFFWSTEGSKLTSIMLRSLYTLIKPLKSNEKCIIISILQLRKPNLREVKFLLQDTQISAEMGCDPKPTCLPVSSLSSLILNESVCPPSCVFLPTCHVVVF